MRHRLINLLCIKMNTFYQWSFHIHPIFIPTAVHNFSVLLFLTSTELENEQSISKAAIVFDVRYHPCFQSLAAVVYNHWSKSISCSPYTPKKDIKDIRRSICWKERRRESKPGSLQKAVTVSHCTQRLLTLNGNRAIYSLFVVFCFVVVLVVFP